MIMPENFTSHSKAFITEIFGIYPTKDGNDISPVEFQVISGGFHFVSGGSTPCN
jgi:hypothetical protein